MLINTARVRIHMFAYQDAASQIRDLQLNHRHHQESMASEYAVKLNALTHQV